MPIKYPAQINFQTTELQRDQLDYISERTGNSRADVLRECIAEAVEAVANRHKVRGIRRPPKRESTP